MGDHHTEASLVSLSFYAAFGFLHEGCHIVASRLGSSHGIRRDGVSLSDLLRALLGRYSLIHMDDDECHEGECRLAMLFVVHSAWIFSVLLALACHAMHRRVRGRECVASWLRSPFLPYAAYVTALEAIATDLLGLVPHNGFVANGAKIIVCYCGNFGIILLNPSWLSIDGGRMALNVLEKMVEVTMMRGSFTLHFLPHLR